MQVSESTFIWESVLPDEHRRLVRLCARLTGDVDAAEDLAQETLLEAWRQAHKLYDPSGYAPWLSAIARNVCLRWWQRSRRELPLFAHRDVHDQGDGCDLLDLQVDQFDLEAELEHHELVSLLDRALAALPAETRSALIAYYVEEAPFTEVAARLGMSRSGLKARLHRGKRMLSRVLLRDFPGEAAALGLIPPDTDTGQETHIWCSECGHVKLRATFDRERGDLALGCPRCTPGQPSGYSWIRLPEVFQGVKGYRAALSRQLAWVYAYTWQALNGQAVACTYCGGPTTLYLGPPAAGPPATHPEPGVHVRCAACHAAMWVSLGSLALGLPEGRRFWRRYPRIHALPSREIEVDGTAAVVRSYQERGGHARFDVLLTRGTPAMIRVYDAAVVEPH